MKYATEGVKDEELQVFDYIDHVFELEGDTGQIDKYLNHLKSCLD